MKEISAEKVSASSPSQGRPETKNKYVTRRRFFQIVGGAVATVFLGSSLRSSEPQSRRPEAEVSTDNGQEAEPPPFLSLYEEYQQFCRHTDIQIENMDRTLYQFVKISNYLADSGTNADPQLDSETKEFIEGWGISKDEAVNLALQKVENMEIFSGPDLSEDWVRNQYVGKIANAFPALAIGLPDQLAVAFPPVTTNEIVQTGLINGGGTKIWDWTNFTHELTHIGDLYYSRFKTVVDLDMYVEYKRQNLQFAGEILSELYEMEDLESAYTYTSTITKWGESITARLFHGGSADNLLDNVNKVETMLGLADLPDATDVQRYTRIIWELGRRQKLNPSDALFQDVACQTIRAISLHDVLHSLVPNGEDITGEYSDNLIGTRMKDLVKYRLKLFGNFEIEGIEPEEQLRQLLGIQAE